MHDLRTEGAYQFELADAEGISSPEEARFRLRITAAPLPVELTRFEAQQASAQSVLLRWETLSETNNAGFEVQRRIAPVETSRRDVSTGESWHAIAMVEGAGTTDAPQSYQFEDTDLPYAADSLTYRLRQVDTDGTETVSEEQTLRVPTPTAVALHAPFPNPARGQATLRYELPEAADVRIQMYDLLGRRVATLKQGDVNAGRYEAQVPVGRLASGTYFVRMQASGTVRTQRLTIVR